VTGMQPICKLEIERVSLNCEEKQNINAQLTVLLSVLE
jgi:hypothetical protein